MNESFLRTISSSTTRNGSDGSNSANTTTIKENQSGLNQSTIREVSGSENPNPKPRRLSTAKKSKKKEDQ